MQIPTIYSLSFGSDLHANALQNTIHALGGRGVFIHELDIVQPTQNMLNQCNEANILQLINVADMKLCLEFITSFRQQNTITPITFVVPADIEFEYFQQLIPLVDFIIFDQISLSRVNNKELTSSKTVKDALHQLTKVISDKLPLTEMPAFIYQASMATENWNSVDICLYQDCEYLLQSVAQQDTNPQVSIYGFTTALVTAFARNYPLDDALVIARAYCNQTSHRGRCHGWPNKRQYFPTVILPNSTHGQQLGLQSSLTLSADFPSCDTDRLGLYPVVDSVEWLEKVLQQGVKTLQLRIKDKLHNEVSDDIQAAITLGEKYQARLFINDYWQLAIKFGAYGVHLGQEDMLTADLNAIKRSGLRLGLSTHGYYEILRAHAIKPSYIALGHIFPTITKDMPSQPQGVLRLQKYADLMQDYPLVAIGGISLERAPLVAATGVGSIAVVTAITRASSYQQAIADFQQVMANFGMTEERDTKLEANYV